MPACKFPSMVISMLAPAQRWLILQTHPSVPWTQCCLLRGATGSATCWDTTGLGPDSGKFTSFQGGNPTTMQRTIIDYVICSKSIFEDIESFTVCKCVLGYDHAATILHIKLNFVTQNNLLANPRKKREIDFSLPEKTELDKPFTATLAAGKDEQKKLLNLYSTVTSTTPRIKVTVHGVCINAGKNSASVARLNSRSRVYGSQTSAQGELWAVILALEKCPGFK
ncbi:hypothetical protein B0H16DRAFT_1487388 [Mycena metata]|uniref:Uncharacterized protein n=1 Tax=Mycena metata TaxID=1033252 RepID=A0AAD7DCH3_9AGAR|nr:hypothetical protein B0H16DRAFT_1487388 [Mycena metata]